MQRCAELRATALSCLRFTLVNLFRVFRLSLHLSMFFLYELCFLKFVRLLLFSIGVRNVLSLLKFMKVRLSSLRVSYKPLEVC